MKPSITLITWLTIIFIKAGIDWYTIEKKKKSPFHKIGITLMAGIAILHGIYIAQIRESGDYAIATFLVYTCTYWAFFDALLNKMRGKELFYIGEHDTEVENAGSDELFQRLGKPSYIISKVVALGLAIVGFYIMIQEHGHS